MKIKKFNEVYDQVPKENWGTDLSDNNYYTFNCEITVRAKSQEEAEDKMEFIANQDNDVELGLYNLSHSTEKGVSKLASAPKEMLERKSNKRK